MCLDKILKILESKHQDSQNSIYTDQKKKIIHSTYICTYIHTYIGPGEVHVCMCVCMYTYIYVYTHVCMCVCMRVCISMYVCMYESDLSIIILMR